MKSFKFSGNNYGYPGKRGTPELSLHGLDALMPFRIREMMLVSSMYDSFILEEDGHISELLLQEYRQLNLWYAPRIIRVPTGEEALSLLSTERRFDLIVPTIRLGEMEPSEFARRVKEWENSRPVTLLGYESPSLQRFIEERRMSGGDYPLDRIFVWTGDARILLAIVNLIEDERNVKHDTEMVDIDTIIFVEDSVRFASAYLPMLYTELMLHSQSLIAEGVNLSQKVVRMRARPKILWCETYEEAIDTYAEFRSNILGVISDVRFPRNGKLDNDAGFRLTRELRADRSDLPILLQSTDISNIEAAVNLDAAFVHKNSPWLTQDVRRFMLEYFGFGPFIFRTPDGTEIARAHGIRDMLNILREVPAKSLHYHGERNHFSTWLKARTQFRLASRLRPIEVTDFPSIEAMRRTLIDGLTEGRRDTAKRAIADFDKNNFDNQYGFARIGGGSIGGKARGLAFLRKLLIYIDDDSLVTRGVRVFVPPTVVIGTDYYDRFLSENSLTELALGETADDIINEAFQRATLPAGLVEDLRGLLELMDYPLAVRSSSMLEDSLEQPFAGIYETFMLSNNSPDFKTRVDDLCAAVKMVYASTFSTGAKAYMRSMPHQPDIDHMAVIIQKLVGRPQGNGARFYPHISGVARSYNYYPFGQMKAEDGVAYIALGMGRTVVEGRKALRFCPRYPGQLPQFSQVDDILENSQKDFYALSMVPKACVKRWIAQHDLEHNQISIADEDGTLSQVSSVYIPEDNIITEGTARSGVRVITFASILKHGTFPLTSIINRLLELGYHGMSSSVEIEFAINLASIVDGSPSEFACLQMRPLVVMNESVDLDRIEVQPQDLLCNSPRALGNGRVEDIYDVIYVLPDEFDASQSLKTAFDVGQYNEYIRRLDRPYILIGPGRWGSADPWLGIPVQWGQISGARVIVEAGMPQRPVSPSEGSHFFQNLTSFRVGYLMINQELGEEHMDWDWLRVQGEIVKEGANGLRWLRLAQPLITLIDGKTNRGVIVKPGVIK